MNNFRTAIEVRPKSPIDHQHTILTAGSCFADHFGVRLQNAKFTVWPNLLGASFQPLAIHHHLEMALTATPPADALFLQRDDAWYHFSFHSRWHRETKAALQDELTSSLHQLKDFLLNTNTLILTYGTAWAYEHVTTRSLVANCHKVASKEFRKHLLSPAQIIDSFTRLREQLKNSLPDLRVILTVSPVRHTRDTLELNAVSKSALRLACHYLAQQFEHVEYYPAYEIMMDDLRDYRFYEKDMIHPNATAHDYIWQHFSSTYFSATTADLIKRIESIQLDLLHRPFRPDSTEHQKFLQQLKNRISELKDQINVDDLMAEVNKRLQP